jgi:hypothetical protein
MLLSPDYSYLLILLPTSLFVVERIISQSSLSVGFDAFSFTSAFGGVILAAGLYGLSMVAGNYYVQIAMLSIVVLSGSVIVFLYSEFKNGFAPLFIWILLLSIIPLPRQWIDMLSSALTKPLAVASASVAGGRLVEFLGHWYIGLVDSSGVMRRFFITPDCSATTSLLSILSIIPLILYLIYLSKPGLKRGTTIFILSVSSGLAVAFTGNILCITLVIHIARHYSYSTAISLLHLSPQIIYTGIAALSSIYVTYKLTFHHKPQRVKISGKTDERHLLVGQDLAKLLSLALLVLAFSFTVMASASNIPLTTKNSVNMDILISHPEEIIFNTSKANITYTATREPSIEETLGVLAVDKLSLQWDNMSASGCIEISRTPSRFHGWIDCLYFQDYKIEKHWTTTYNTKINYAIASKKSQKLLLAYTITRYQTNNGDLYVKLTVSTPVTRDNYKVKTHYITNLLENTNHPSYNPGLIDNAVKSIYLGLIILLITALTSVIHRIRLTKK